MKWVQALRKNTTKSWRWFFLLLEYFMRICGRTDQDPMIFCSKTRKWHCVKSVRIRSYSGPHFPTFGLNTERYSVSLRIQSKCRKMRTRITPKWTLFTQCEKENKRINYLPILRFIASNLSNLYANYIFLFWPSIYILLLLNL